MDGEIRFRLTTEIPNSGILETDTIVDIEMIGATPKHIIQEMLYQLFTKHLEGVEKTLNGGGHNDTR